MSFPDTIPAAILETILPRLALLFLAGAAGDPNLARSAAIQMLAAYKAQTPDEITLAAEIISCSFHTLELFARSAEPGLSLNDVLRIHASAVGLSRESHKAQRRLHQLQRARQKDQKEQKEQKRQAEQQEPPQPEAAEPQPAKAQTVPRPEPQPAQRLTWTQAHQQRQTTLRLSRKQRRQLAAQAAAPKPPAP